MTLRSRPVLDRKHRPRWQDELRTQQLIVVGFAIAIAVAIGIFGAAAWNGYWETHSRPVADVDGTSFDRADLDERETILTMELVAKLQELQAQLTGGPRDQILNQQIEQLNPQASSLPTTAADSLVDGEVLASRAGEFDVTVTDDEVDAEVAQRLALPERVHANLILIAALPEDAEAGAEPTDEQRQAAARRGPGREGAGRGRRGLRGRRHGGQRRLHRRDRRRAGLVRGRRRRLRRVLRRPGRCERGRPGRPDRDRSRLRGARARRATRGDRRGPARRACCAATASATRQYRDYVRSDILDDAYREHFETASSSRRGRSGGWRRSSSRRSAAPRCRRSERATSSSSPTPSLQDQAEATDEQWEAALAEAEEVQASSCPPRTPTGTRSPRSTATTPAPAPRRRPGLVRPGELAVRAGVRRRARRARGRRDQRAGPHRVRLPRDPEDRRAREPAGAGRGDRRAARGRSRRLRRAGEQHSEDAEPPPRAASSAGWRATSSAGRRRTPSSPSPRSATSARSTTPGAGIVIYQLLETSESQEIEEDRLDEIRANGFERWLDEVVRDGVETWIDPQFDLHHHAA